MNKKLYYTYRSDDMVIEFGQKITKNIAHWIVKV
jgi:hypothetical protein